MKILTETPYEGQNTLLQQGVLLRGLPSQHVPGVGDAMMGSLDGVVSELADGLPDIPHVTPSRTEKPRVPTLQIPEDGILYER